MCIGVLHTCMHACVPCAYTVPTEDRRECLIPWNWDSFELPGTHLKKKKKKSAWSLETVTNCPVGVLNSGLLWELQILHWAISPAPELFSFMVNFIVKLFIFRGLFSNWLCVRGLSSVGCNFTWATFYCTFSSKINLLCIGTLKHSCRKCRLARLLPGG